MILAGFSSVGKSYPSGSILNDVSGVVKSGDRIALLGSNGTGKSTLLEIIAGRITSDAGKIEMPNDVNCRYLPQEINIDNGGSLFEYAIAGFGDLLKMHAEIERIHNRLSEEEGDSKLLSELGNLQEKFEAAGGYEMESRVKMVLAGVGFNPAEFDKPMNTLSGGQRNRAALAAILISAPDLLLLDEPTNHLDISGLEFLEEYLKSYEGGVIFVSHDRTFIRNSATLVWELNGGVLDVYAGDYIFYLTERERRFVAGLKEYEAQQEYIRRTSDFISRNIAGQKTRQAQSRRKMLARMERLQKPSQEKTISRLDFGKVGRSTKTVVKCERVSFSYDDKSFLKNIDFEIERGEKIGLFGPNGSGKTTIIKLITRNINPNDGTVEIGGKTSIGYYDQLSEHLDFNSSPLETIREVKPEWIESQIRSYLGRFLFGGEDVKRPVKSFSGGERSRLAIARIIVNNPNFLVLDEPTNHLDIRSREALEEALAEYEGAVLCVSHDRYFLDSFAEKIFEVDDGTVKVYLGNYSDYKDKKIRNPEETAADKTGSMVRTQYRPKRERKINPQIVQKVRDKIASMEKEIDKIEHEIAGLEGSSDWQRLTALLDARDDHYYNLESLYEELDDLTNEYK